MLDGELVAEVVEEISRCTEPVFPGLHAVRVQAQQVVNPHGVDDGRAGRGSNPESKNLVLNVLNLLDDFQNELVGACQDVRRRLSNRKADRVGKLTKNASNVLADT